MNHDENSSKLPRPLKVLHATHQMNPKAGGVSQAIVNIIEGLSELGVENEVISLDAASEIPHGIMVHALGPGSGPWSYSKKLKPWLTEHLSSFDIIIIHGLWLYHGYAVSKMIRHFKKNKITSEPSGKNNQRLFTMPHGMLDPYFQKTHGRKLKALRNIVYWKFIEQYIVNGSDGILFTCQEESILARETFKPYRPKRELIVGLGVKKPPCFSDIMQTEFLKKCPQLTDQTPYILFLSRIHPKKGVDILIQAYENLFRKLSDMTLLPKLVIAGPGINTSYGQVILKKVSESQRIKNSVYFPGMLEGTAKWGAFYNAVFFILPSHQENFGIAVVEAMACGKPTAITNQVNIWREIEEGGGGFVSEDTLSGIEGILEKCISLKDDEIKILGLRAKTLFQNEFSIIPAAKRLLTEITAVISSSTPATRPQ